MLCRAGLVPVLNDDQATGDTDGNVVRKAAVAALVRQRWKFGSLPACRYRSVNLRILSVEADDDEPRDQRPSMPPAPQDPPRHPKRPDQQRGRGDDDRS